MDVSNHEYVIILLYKCKWKLEYCSALTVGSKNFTNATAFTSRLGLPIHVRPGPAEYRHILILYISVELICVNFTDISLHFQFGI